ncbi:unnamed protein product [Mytilus edulis]|uniref:Caspase family p20 domain-containing protein n=1 Tax=Mytilus edulis TaxID=6550 RepID=A0A8S3QIH9_MYTED|nr:unnamed protein product [Mytilus edulis]
MPLSNCFLLHKSTKLYSSVLKTASSKSNLTIPTDENEYEFNKRYRGLAIIISNENFTTLTCRKYCDDEIRLMQETFGKCLKFTVITFKDLKAKQINLVLKIACKQTEFHQQSDYFACVLASHGTEKSRTMKTPGVYYRDHCICGVDEDTACRMKMDETAIESCIDQGHVLPVKIAVKENNQIIISDHADKCFSGSFIFLFDYFRKTIVRKEDQGGWMLISLHKAVKEQLRVQKETNRIDILDVLIFMTREVSNSETFQTKFPEGTVNPKRKATIVFEHCLHKELYLYNSTD